MGRYGAVLLLLVTGCAGPLAPTTSAPPARVDPAVADVVAILDTIQTPLPWNGLSFRAWRQQVNVPIIVGPLPENYGAGWSGTGVVLNDHLTGYDLYGKAGLIAHELRHADGMAHDCGSAQDHRATAWSAYAVQIWVLDQLGAHDQAQGNESGYCD